MFFGQMPVAQKPVGQMFFDQKTQNQFFSSKTEEKSKFGGKKLFPTPSLKKYEDKVRRMNRMSDANDPGDASDENGGWSFEFYVPGPNVLRMTSV
jgi:hypothetical protein